MKKVFVALSLAVPLASGLVTSASADTFNFLANQGTATTAQCLVNPGVGNPVFCGQPITFSGSSITLNATGVGNPGSGIGTGNQASIDWNEHGGRRGGLGVSWNEQVDVSFGDVLTLTFSKPVVISAISFHDDQHNLLSLSPNTYDVDGLITPFSSSMVGGPARSVFNFRGIGTDFYIASLTAVEPVPEPSTWALLGVGLLGLGYMARRRTKNA